MADIAALDVEKICRVCLQSNLELFLIFDDSYSVDGIGISDMLSECTIHKVKRFDELPHLICNECMGNVKNAFRFKKQCERSHRLLIDLLEKRQDDEIKPILTFSNTDVSSEKATQTEDTALYPCELCEKKFFSYDLFKEHRTNDHKGSAVQCRFCLKNFHRLDYLKGHIAKFHPENGFTSTNTCSICKKNFMRKDHLSRHMVIVHRVKVSGWGEKNALDEPEIEFKCEIDKYEEDDCAAQQLKNPSISLPTQSILSPVAASVCSDESEQGNAISEETKSKTNSIQSSDDEYDDIPLAKLLASGKLNTSTKQIEDQGFISISASNQIITEKEKRVFSVLANVQSEVENQEHSTTNTNSFVNDKEIVVKKESPKAAKSTTGDDKPVRGKLLESVTETDKPKYNCTGCSKTFKQNSHLKRHLLTHGNEKPFPCNICPRRFKRADHLKNHLETHNEATFRCDKCQHAFTRRDYLKDHIELKHSGLKLSPEVCEICHKSFATKSYLRRHLVIHLHKRYSCRNCEKKFMTKENMEEHMKTHSNTKPFLCSECGARFDRSDNLVIHMRRHNGEKPFKCKFCNKAFPRLIDLNVHERYHTGEKTHICTICGKGFQRSYNLVVHMRVHTGERPYKCSHCPSSFAQSYDLKAHVRRHTGERFKCEICGCGFIQAYHLSQHMSRVHGIQVKARTGRITKYKTQQEQEQQIKENLNK